MIRNNKFDIDLIKQYDFSYLTIHASGFFGKKTKDVIVFFINLIKSLITFPLLLIKNKPQAIVATGGFVSLVPLFYCLIFHIKYFLLEQNRIPGRVTKYFSRWAHEIYLGFPLVTKIKGCCVYTGNPLRTSLINSKNPVKKNDNVVLVLGGSTGAQFLNLNVIEVANQLRNVHFIILTGKHNYQEIKQLVKSNNCKLIDFTLHPEELYEQAKIIITRAGGMVLSEILFFGLPSIIIPFPFATDNHQAANAQFLAQNNAAIIINQPHQQGLSIDFIKQLANDTQKLLSDKEKIIKMTNNARKISKRNAAQCIAERIKLCLVK